MKLPSKFQVRLASEPGFTHSVKCVDGVCKVKWARGWYIDRNVEWDNCHISEAQEFVEDGRWIIVDQPEAKQEDALPDEFYFTVKHGVKSIPFYHGKVSGKDLLVVWSGMGDGTPVRYPLSTIKPWIKEGSWKIIDKKPLTAEQQKANKEFREQIQQLNNSIRIQEQTVEHHERMIANYKGRIADLEQKIVEEV